LESRKDRLINDIFIRRDGGNHPQGKEQWSLLRTDHPPGNDDLLILTRLLLSSDDSDDNFSKTPLKTRTVTVINQAILYPGLFSNYTHLSPPVPNSFCV
jgi:hypothetical protein